MASIDEDIEKGLELGDGAFFKSEITPEELVKMVKEWLSIPAEQFPVSAR